MSYPIQDLAEAFFTHLRGAPGTPALTVYDGEVPDNPEPVFARVRFFIETPSGLVAPDVVPLTMDSEAIDAVAYVACVGSSALTQGGGQAADSSRAVAGRVYARLHNQRLTVPGRSCNPVRWLEGQPPRPDEDLPGRIYISQTDVYGWRSVPS